MEDKLIKYLNELGIDFTNKSILLAVSGGRDSMVMATLFLKAQIPFEIAHFNFQLRGEDSILDERFVKAFADKHQLVFHIKREDTASYSEANKQGIQEAARDLRYCWFDSILQERNLDYVATAHHKDDAAETMIFNFIRGGSFAALKGIASHHKNIIRPLLFASQEDIKNYTETNQVDYREDQSNQSTKYSRNRIRHKVIPELKKINPSLIETMSRTAKIYQQGAFIIDQVIEKELSAILIDEGNTLKIPVQHLRDSKYQNLLVWQWIKSLGFGSKQVNEIIGLLQSNSGKKTSSATHEIFRDRDYLLAHPITQENFQTITFNALEDLLKSSVFKSEIIDTPEVDFSKNNSIAFFDANKIVFPASLRIWKDGDHFSPLGMKGKSQKISDLLIQEKVAVLDKKSVLVLTFNTTIAWVIDFRVSEGFKVESDTLEVLRLEYLG